MVTDNERMVEWLQRSADQIHALRRKPRLSTEKCLESVRENYNVINVLTMVAENKAYMLGISPINTS